MYGRCLSRPFDLMDLQAEIFNALQNVGPGVNCAVSLVTGRRHEIITVLISGVDRAHDPQNVHIAHTLVMSVIEEHYRPPFSLHLEFLPQVSIR